MPSSVLIAFGGITSHASRRAQNFILFALASTVRFVVVHGRSTLGCILLIAGYKDNTKSRFFVSHIIIIIRICCLVTIRILGSIDHPQVQVSGQQMLYHLKFQPQLMTTRLSVQGRKSS